MQIILYVGLLVSLSAVCQQWLCPFYLCIPCAPGFCLCLDFSLDDVTLLPYPSLFVNKSSCGSILQENSTNSLYNKSHKLAVLHNFFIVVFCFHFIVVKSCLNISDE